MTLLPIWFIVIGLFGSGLQKCNLISENYMFLLMCNSNSLFPGNYTMYIEDKAKDIKHILFASLRLMTV